MRYKLGFCTSAVCSALYFTSISAFADINFNGFARIAAGTTLESNEAVMGYKDSLDFKNESLFALQASANLDDGLSATAQFMSRGRDDFEVDVEWAYLSYELTDSTRINAGRLRLPFFRYSDFLDVGYAYTWVRPPQAVYDLPYSSYDGLSILHSTTLGDFDIEVQGTLGTASEEIEVEGTPANTELDDLYGLNLSATYDWLYLRAVYMIGQASFDISNPQLNQLLQALMLTGNSNAAEQIKVDSDSSSFAGIGFGVDKSDWIFQGEITQTKVDDSFIADRYRSYVSLAHRFDVLTPYITYQKIDDKANPTGYNLAVESGVLPADVLAGIKTFLQSQEQDAEGEYYSIGTRYDFHPSASFKADLTIWNGEYTQDAQVISFAVDMVF
ncbi:porin [Catenovulum sp. 2E275]|uniref:porin n=1 Tax=Catenovulum sp. 2E275 TaxID=2980497 RepID=UPI0021D301CD|nr:porin [Catenovulum sp. 2E275]MCU4675652.1 porin [Catenovulum sp. 2E275]